MIKEVKGDLLSVTKGFIVHGCNAHGVMGSGVAKQIRAKYPKCYDIYSNYCKDLREFTDSMIVFEHNILGVVPMYQHDDLIIFNAITQFNYGTDSRKVDYEAVYRAFETINAYIMGQVGVDRVLNFPMIGCGLAGGNWNIVKTIIDEVVDDSIEKVLWIYEG